MKYLTINNIEKLQDMVSKQRYRVNPYTDMDSFEDTFEVIYATERGDTLNPIYVIRLEGKNTRTGMWFWVYRWIKDGTVRVQKEYDFINTQGTKTTETVSAYLTVTCFNQPDVLMRVFHYALWETL